MRIHRKVICMLCVLLTAILPVARDSNAFWSLLLWDYHSDITKLGLEGIRVDLGTGEPVAFTSEAINEISAWNVIADDGRLYEDIWHFDNENFVFSHQNLVEIRQELVEGLNDPEARDPARHWSRLGFALHAIQDFYSHSNVSTQAPFFGTSTRGGAFPFGGAAGPFDPTCLPGNDVLDPQARLTTGYYEKVYGPTPAGKCRHGEISYHAARFAFDCTLINQGINNDYPCQPRFKRAFDQATAATTDFVQSIIDQLLEIEGGNRAVCRLMGIDVSDTRCLVLEILQFRLLADGSTDLQNRIPSIATANFDVTATISGALADVGETGAIQQVPFDEVAACERSCVGFQPIGRLRSAYPSSDQSSVSLPSATVNMNVTEEWTCNFGLFGNRSANGSVSYETASSTVGDQFQIRLTMNGTATGDITDTQFETSCADTPKATGTADILVRLAVPRDTRLSYASSGNAVLNRPTSVCNTGSIQAYFQTPCSQSNVTISRGYCQGDPIESLQLDHAGACLGAEQAPNGLQPRVNYELTSDQSDFQEW